MNKDRNETAVITFTSNYTYIYKKLLVVLSFALTAIYYMHS